MPPAPGAGGIKYSAPRCPPCPALQTGTGGEARRLKITRFSELNPRRRGGGSARSGAQQPLIWGGPAGGERRFRARPGGGCGAGAGGARAPRKMRQSPRPA